MQPASSGASGVARRPRCPWPETTEEIIRVISQSELLRATKFELQVLLRGITASLPYLAEGSHELRIAHFNLHNIRLAMAKPELRPR
jgi:hypothetical protein